MSAVLETGSDGRLVEGVDLAEIERFLEEMSNSVDHRLREFVIRYFFQRRSLADTWLPFLSMDRVRPVTTRCVSCGREVEALAVDAGDRRHLGRRYTICPRCGIVEDSPLWVSATLRVDDQLGVRLEGNFPRHGVRAGLLILTPSWFESSAWDWPVEDGLLAPHFHPDHGEIPIGPINFSVVLVWNDDYAILNHSRILR